jgi:hypothetical protein
MIWDVRIKRFRCECFCDGNIGNDQVEDFNRPAAGANCVLATSDFDNEDIIKVYPNPSSGVINIRK